MSTTDKISVKEIVAGAIILIVVLIAMFITISPTVTAGNEMRFVLSSPIGISTEDGSLRGNDTRSGCLQS